MSSQLFLELHYSETVLKVSQEWPHPTSKGQLSIFMFLLEVLLPLVIYSFWNSFLGFYACPSVVFFLPSWLLFLQLTLMFGNLQGFHHLASYQMSSSSYSLKYLPYGNYSYVISSPNFSPEFRTHKIHLLYSASLLGCPTGSTMCHVWALGTPPPS